MNHPIRLYPWKYEYLMSGPLRSKVTRRLERTLSCQAKDDTFVLFNGLFYDVSPVTQLI